MDTSAGDIYLHTCCGPCCCGCIGALTTGRPKCLFFSNSNLNTREEYEKRLAEVEKLGRRFAIPVIADEYNHAAWLAFVKGLENEPEHGERCRKCFAFSFARTADAAARTGNRFTSTLSISPYKDSRMLMEVGAKFAGFVPVDFGIGGNYRNGRMLAREMQMYFQQFCGCEFSLRDAERFRREKAEKKQKGIL